MLLPAPFLVSEVLHREGSPNLILWDHSFAVAGAIPPQCGGIAPALLPTKPFS